MRRSSTKGMCIQCVYRSNNSVMYACILCVYITVGEREKWKLKPGYNHKGTNHILKICHTVYTFKMQLRRRPSQI